MSRVRFSDLSSIEGAENSSCPLSLCAGCGKSSWLDLRLANGRIVWGKPTTDILPRSDRSRAKGYSGCFLKNWVESAGCSLNVAQSYFGGLAVLTIGSVALCA